MKKLLFLLVLLPGLCLAQITNDPSLRSSINTIGNYSPPQIRTILTAIVDSKQNVINGVTASGTDNYTITPPNPITSYAAITNITVRFTNGNTGPVTLRINALAYKDVFKKTSQPLVLGDILDGQIINLSYDGTNFQLVGTNAGDSWKVAGNTTLTGNADVDGAFNLGFGNNTPLNNFAVNTTASSYWSMPTWFINSTNIWGVDVASTALNESSRFGVVKPGTTFFGNNEPIVGGAYVSRSTEATSNNTVEDGLTISRTLNNNTDPGVNGIGSAIAFNVRDDNAASYTYAPTARVKYSLNDVTNGSEDGQFDFTIAKAGASTQMLKLDGTGLSYPVGLAAGTAPEWLTTKAYVDVAVAGGGSFTLTNGNGTTAAGTAVNLGGTTTSDIVIKGNNGFNVGSSNNNGIGGSLLLYSKNNFDFGVSDHTLNNSAFINANIDSVSTGGSNLTIQANGTSSGGGANINIGTSVIAGANLSLFSGTTTNSNEVILSSTTNVFSIGDASTSNVFTDGRATKTGLRYNGNYFTTYTDRTLSDYGVVTRNPFKTVATAATTANITLSGTQTVDGQPLVAGNTCLVKNQTTTTQNGLYTVSASAWTLVTDFNGGDDNKQGSIFSVRNGTVNGGSFWICTLNPSTGFTGGSTALSFNPFGTSMLQIGDLEQGASSGLHQRLASVATGNALISGGVGVVNSWGKIGLTTHVSGTLPVANGGTGSTSTPTNGQLLIGNGTGFTTANLSAGNGIAVSNSAGSITVGAGGTMNNNIAYNANSANNYDFSVGSTTPVQSYFFGAGVIGSANYANLAGNSLGVDISWANATQSWNLDSDGINGIIFIDQRTIPKGIRYGSGNSYETTAESLTSRAYVDANKANINTITGALTLNSDHTIILADATTAGFVVTLPTAASATKKKYLVKKIDATANTVTINVSGGGLIDGSTTQVISAQWYLYEVASNGTAWYIVGQ